MGKYNYFDSWQDKFGKYSDFVSKRYINAVSPNIRFYILDRNRIPGPDVDIYNESKNLIYLPYIKMRAVSLIKKWTQPLNKNAIEEPDDSTTDLVLNFEEMITSLNKIKYLHLSDLNISYLGSLKAGAENKDNILKIYENCNIIQEYDLEQYCLEELKDNIHGLNNFDASIKGDKKESASNLINFEKTEITINEILNIYTQNKIYENISKKIQIGDMFITQHNVLYEIVDAFVANLRFTTWTSYVVKGEKRKLSDNIQLPNGGLDDIYSNNYLIGSLLKDKDFISY